MPPPQFVGSAGFTVPVSRNGPHEDEDRPAVAPAQSVAHIPAPEIAIVHVDPLQVMVRVIPLPPEQSPQVHVPTHDIPPVLVIGKLVETHPEMVAVSVVGIPVQPHASTPPPPQHGHADTSIS